MKKIALPIILASSSFAYGNCGANNDPNEICSAFEQVSDDLSDMVKPSNILPQRDYQPIHLKFSNGQELSDADLNRQVDVEIDGQVKRFALRDYQNELNAIEKKLNLLGRSLRDSDDFGVITEVPIDREKLAAQIANTTRTIRAFDPNSMRALLSTTNLDQLEQEARQRATQVGLQTIRDLAAESGLPPLELPDNPRMPTLLPVTKVEIPEFKSEKERVWILDQGQRSTVRIFGDAKLKMAGVSTDSKSRTARGQVSGQFGVNLFNSPDVNLGYAYADYKAPQFGKQVANVRFMVMGFEIYKKEKEINGKWGDRYQKGINYEKQFPFMIGVIPCLATIGARGSLYFSWELGLNPLNAQGDAKVGAKAEAYASVEATVVVAGIGAAGNIEVVADELQLQGLASLRFDQKNYPFMDINLNAWNEIRALNGRLYAYAYIRVPECDKGDFLGVPYPRCGLTKKSYEQDLAVLNGYVNRGNIMSFHLRLSPFGSSVSGKDVRLEDRVETKALKELTANLDDQQRLATLTNELNKANLEENQFFKDLGSDLAQNGGGKITAPHQAAAQIAETIKSKVDQYMGDL